MSALLIVVAAQGGCQPADPEEPAVEEQQQQAVEREVNAADIDLIEQKARSLASSLFEVRLSDDASIDVGRLRDPHFDKVFPNWRLYAVSVPVTLPPKTLCMCSNGEVAISLPLQFRSLQREAGVRAREEDAVAIATALAAVEILNRSPAFAGTIKVRQSSVTGRGGHLAVSLTTWTMVNGIVEEWTLWFVDGMARFMRSVVQEVESGEYERAPEVPRPQVGASHAFELRDKPSSTESEE